MKRRMFRRVGALTMVLVGAGWTMPASAGAPAPDAPGEVKLVNLAFVYNFNPGGAPSQARGTDIEFYTSDRVALRDADGNEVLDAEGNPVFGTRDFAVMGSYNRGAFVFDITDPEHPSLATLVPCNQQQNDVQVKRFGDRWILALTKEDYGGSGMLCGPRLLGVSGTMGGISVFDVTDPYEVVPMYSFRVPAGGAHNFTFHPTRPIGWVSTGSLHEAHLDDIPIIDFTDVDNPVLAGDVEGTVGAAHDIAFSADGTRAYVASENNWAIWDSTDPLNPVLISRTPDAGTYAHGLDPTPDGEFLVGGNESQVLGGWNPWRAVCPGEGLTFFNISGANEQAPVLPAGQFFANVAGRPADARPCTAHVGKVAPNSHVMSVGWYIGGARVVDFANPAAPTEVASAVLADTNAWSAKFYKGPYLYVGDENRGFDVLRWALPGPAPWQ